MPRTLPLLLLALTAALAAQDPVYPRQELLVAADSGYLDNAGSAATTVFAQDFTLANCSFVQLHFGATNLPTGSHLRLWSTARTDWVQWHDGGTLRDYGFVSCQFIGPTVHLELVAGAGTTGNRVIVDAVRGLLMAGVGATDTLCGNDDRVLASDPRVCRLDVSCTAFLFSPYAVSTAGHCFSSTAGHMLHFNVPLSDAAGTPMPSAPNDQYALEAFLQQLYTGNIGEDWSVAAAIRNSNTGLFPGQAQGSWFALVSPPALGAGQNLRVTGYGTGTGISGSPTWNQVQTSDVGPRVATAWTNAIGYEVDTTGGDSGAPVILESSGDVVGVHTNAGCNLAAGIGNTGTSAGRTDWATARAAAEALHVVGSFQTLGDGCGGNFGAPGLTFLGVPELGHAFTVTAGSLDPNHSNFGLFWCGTSTPAVVDLAQYGVQGCSLMLVLPVATLTTFTANGRADLPVSVPNATVLLSLNVWFQYFALDDTASNSLGGVFSNVGGALLGN